MNEPVYTVCQECRYPLSGAGCNNPACYANPAVQDAQKAIWKVEREKRQTEENERDRIHRIRDRMRRL